MLARLDGSVFWCNGAGDALLKDREHFFLRGDKLTGVDPAREAELRAFIERAPDDCSTWVSRSDTSLLIVMREVLPGDELVGLTFHSAEPTVEYVWADFGPALGLTVAEARVAQKLMQGAGADGIAKELGVGIETVRTHIRRMYNKLEIGSREELFSRLSPFRLR